MAEDGPAGMRNLLFVVDLEDTLVTKDSPRELTEEGIPAMLKELSARGVLLFLCSRNPPHAVQDALAGLQLAGFFQAILADYRPRDYQVRHALWKVRERRLVPPALLFVDDHPENCQRVARLRGELEVPLYSIVYAGQPPRDLQTIGTALIEGNLAALRALSL